MPRIAIRAAPRAHHATLLCLILAVGGCSTTPRQTQAATSPPPQLHPAVALDPMAVGFDADAVGGLCERQMVRAQDNLSAIKWLAGVDEPSWENTLGAIDDIAYEVGLGIGLSELMSVGHPDEGVRTAAKACRPRVEAFYTEMMLDAQLAAAVERYADTSPQLTGTRKRLLDELRRDFKRNGLSLPAQGQATLRKLNEEITELEQSFDTNLSDAIGSIEVTPAQLAGTPQSFRDAHPPGENGKVKLTTDYPDYFPVLTYAQDRSIAKALNFQFENRAADKNVAILERVLVLRQQKAELLGYGTWADFVLETRMAKSAKAVQDFLAGVADTVQAPAETEYAMYAQAYASLGGPAVKAIPNYERPYLTQQLKIRHYDFDDKKLSEYFEVGAVTQGVLDIVGRLYGLQFVERPQAATWHEDVRTLDVIDDGQVIAHVYLDLYPREGKYKHAAMFGLRDGKRLSDGSYVRPISTLMCNFPRTTDAAPGLLTHGQVETFFHEFGHAIHHSLSTEALASFSGTSTARDFVEAPSQMLEEWAWNRQTLDMFARHHESGAAIPDALFESMTRARTFGRALGTQRQLSLAALDMTYHTRRAPLDSDAVRLEVMAQTQRFTYQPGTHFQGTFGHLMGYDAGYYGYQWALALAQDVLTRFTQEGMLNTAVADDFRHKVLAKGAGADEALLIEDFLGRPSNLEAYGRYLAAGAPIPKAPDGERAGSTPGAKAARRK